MGAKSMDANNTDVNNTDAKSTDAKSTDVKPIDDKSHDGVGLIEEGVGREGVGREGSVGIGEGPLGGAVTDSHKNSHSSHLPGSSVMGSDKNTDENKNTDGEKDVVTDNGDEDKGDEDNGKDEGRGEGDVITTNAAGITDTTDVDGGVAAVITDSNIATAVNEVSYHHPPPPNLNRIPLSLIHPPPPNPTQPYIISKSTV